MFIRFWGVRGSLPTPLLNNQVQAKIAAAVARITPKDIESEESRKKFLENLPSWIYGTTGGNTACVEIKTKNGTEIIIDCGTGLRVFSQIGQQPDDLHYHIFLSHFHWDHIQGFPFFVQTFNPKAKIDIYTNFKDAETYFKGQSTTPYFPENAGWNSIKNQISFHLLKEDKAIELDGLKITSHKMKHPGDSYAFSFEEGDKKFIYSSDTELQFSDFDKSKKSNKFFENADILVLDTQYTNLEAIEKENWGHSSFSNAIDFASLWNVKKLYQFHHEPNYDDEKLYSILQDGFTYKNYNQNCKVELYTAQEGMEIEL